MATAADVLAIAAREIGTWESPRYSNRQKHGVAFGLNTEPWCTEFGWWCFDQAGVKLPLKTAGVYALMDSCKRIGLPGT